MSSPSGTVLVVTGEYPPDRGGVADYAQQWVQHGAAMWPDLDVQVLSTRRWGLSSLWERTRQVRNVEADVVLFHYVPHMYDAKGLPIWIPLYTLMFRSRSVRIVVLLHELENSDPGLRRKAVKAIQRVLWVAVATLSAKVVVTTRTRHRAVIAAAPWLRSKVDVIPISPSLDLSDAPDGNEAGPVVLVYFGSRHPSREFSMIVSALDLLDSHGVAYELRVIGTADAPDDRATVLGYLDEDDVIRELGRADIALLPFTDGASTRRTTVMNCLAAGLAVVSTIGRDTDVEWLSSAMRLCNTDGTEFSRVVRELAGDSDARKAVADAGLAWLNANASWTAVEPDWRQALGH